MRLPLVIRRFGGRLAAEPALALSVSVCWLKAALDAGYVAAIASRYAYTGLGLQPDALKYVESWVITLLLAHLAGRRLADERPSSVLTTLFLALPVLPLLSLYGLRGMERLPMYFMVAAFVAVLFARELPIPELPSSLTAARAALVACGVLVVVAIVRLVAIGGLAEFNLDPMSVYEHRVAASELINVGAWAYALGWAFKVANVTLMAWALLRRRLDWLAVFVVIQVFFFAISSHKALLFYPVLLIVVRLVYKMRRPTVALLYGFALLTLLGMELGVWTGENLVTDLFLRRTMFVPPLLDFVHFDYFGRVGHVFLSNSVLRSVLVNPFPASTANMIGLYAYGKAATTAGTGFLGSGFMHFGYAGTLAYSIVVGWLLGLVDRTARAALPAWMCTALVSVPFVLVFTSADLGTTLLTHGLAVSILVLVMMRGYVPPSRGRPPRVAHVTTVHPWDDTRIFRKECRSLARAGFDTLLLAPEDSDAEVDGVRIVALTRQSGRLARMTVGLAGALRAARAARADVYHLHDPELLLLTPPLLLLGKHIIYDAHENTAQQIASKYWIPTWLRPAVSATYRLVESGLLLGCDAIVAATPEVGEAYRSRRTVVVRNLPLTEEFDAPAASEPRAGECIVAYIGGISDARGIWEMLDALTLVRESHPVNLLIAGPIQPPSLLPQLERHPAWPYVRFLGRVSPEQIPPALTGCTAGLCVLHPLRNYLGAWPVKLFEYMATGLPVIASDFPLWRQIVDGAGCGMLVDPLDPAQIADALLYLVQHPEEARAMGTRGRTAAREQYDWASQVPILLSVYGEFDDPLGEAARSGPWRTQP